MNRKPKRPLLCRLGLHCWKQGRMKLTRYCKRCPKVQVMCTRRNIVPGCSVPVTEYWWEDREPV